MKGLNGLNLGTKSRSLNELSGTKEFSSGNLNLNLNGISNFNLQPYKNKACNYHPALDWNERQVLQWLSEVGLSQYEALFIEHDINGEVLLELDHSLLKMMAVPTVGARVRILLAIKNLKSQYYEKLRNQLLPPKEIEPAPSSLEVIEPNFQSPKLSPLGTFSSLFSNKNRSSDGSSKASSKIEKNRNKQLFEYTASPPTSPDSTITFTNPFMNTNLNKQNCVRVYGNDGEIRIVDVSESKDAYTILKKVLGKFNIYDEPEKYAIFVVNGDSTRSLNDDELVDICNSTDRPEKGKFILRKKHLPMSHLQFKQLKARKHVGRKVEVLPNTSTPNSKTDKLTKIFGKRPPSELISQDLSNFFPEAELDTNPNQNADLGVSGMGDNQSLGTQVKISEIRNEYELPTLPATHSPRPIPITERKPLPPHPFYNSMLTPVVETLNSNQFQAPSSNIKEQKWIKGPLIGAGSFGDVYLGLNPTNGELMAVKQVNLPNKEANKACEQRIQTLQREIELLKDMDHPNIVRYLGSQIEDHHLNILLEYVPGGSVSGLLTDYGPFEERLVAIFVKQILNGLDYLHKQNIIHRDIKGGNILVDNKGKVKITDFGVSKKVQEEVLSAVTNQRASLQGSVFWMAPEVVKQTIYTQKADIWGLGCLVVEMMTGTHPFPHFTQMQAIFKIGSDAAPEIPEHASPSSRDFLNLTFTIDHHLRPDAAQLLTHLFITDPPTPTTNPATITSP